MSKSLYYLTCLIFFISCSKDNTNINDKGISGEYSLREQIGYRYSSESTFENPVVSDEISYQPEGLLTINEDKTYKVNFLKDDNNLSDFSGRIFQKATEFSVEKYLGNDEKIYLKTNNKYFVENKMLIMELKGKVLINGKSGELLLSKLYFDPK